VFTDIERPHVEADERLAALRSERASLD